MKQLLEHLQTIAHREGISVEEEGLRLIARAAEGSVRDALSLLDQALVQDDEGRGVTQDTIRTMMGLADKGRVLTLFDNILQGQNRSGP